MRFPARRQVRFTDDEALFYDDEVLITRDAAWTAVRVPLVPYGFRSRDDRLALGRRTITALAALRDGDFRLIVARRPHSGRDWAARTGELVEQIGAPSPAWPGLLERQAARIEEVQGTEKVVVLLRRLGQRQAAAQWASRSGLPLGSGELSFWRNRAREARDVLARNGLDARPLDAVDLRWLRGHALRRGMVPPRPTATGRRAWTAQEVEQEFHDVTLTALPRGVQVDTETGTTFTATLVAAAFPMESRHPDSPPWLAHLDWVGPWAEADVHCSLITPRKAKGDVLRRFRLAQDQHHDASSAGAEAPIETEEMYQLARELETSIPRRRLPLVYGWARFRVDAASEEELAYRVARITERFADEDSPQLDLVLPTGQAQLDLLCEAVPGQKVAHKSWRQRWTLETVACSLPQAGSNLGHSTGLYVGPTTGRYVQAVTLDPHHSITRRTLEDVEGPGGMVLLGAQRSGKSNALGRLLDDGTARGWTSVCLDFSGPLARLADLPRNAGRIQVLNLVKTGGGILDPMSPAVIPGDDGLAREQRRHLTRDTLYLIARRQLHGSVEASTELLRAITAESEERFPSLRGVVARLTVSTNVKAQALAEHLTFELGGENADALFGHGESVDDHGEPVTRIITAPGLPLPTVGTRPDDWMPAQALGAALFGVAAHLGRRLLWDLPAHHLKYLLVDEAHIAMGTEAGRRVIEQALRDGPKHGVVVGLATHNAVDLSDERIVNAIATKMLFRSTAETELERSHAIAGLEDTPAVRRQRVGLRNGECILVTDQDVRDRVQWDLGWDAELAGNQNTTPSGAR